MNYETSPVIENIATALAGAQADIEHADANATGQAKGGKYKYAKLENVITAIKAPFAKHGLSYVQLPARDGAECGVTTILMHKSGEFIRCTFLMPAGQSMTPQGFGSLLTYARRYSLTAICGIGQEDDDAKSANDSVAKDSKVADLVESALAPEREKAAEDAKKASMVFFAGYTKLAVRYAENIQMMNSSAEADDNTGIAIARLGIDDDDFASLNKLRQDMGGVYSDKCKKMISTQGFADVLQAELSKEDAA